MRGLQLDSIVLDPSIHAGALVLVVHGLVAGDDLRASVERIGQRVEPLALTVHRAIVDSKISVTVNRR